MNSNLVQLVGFGQAFPDTRNHFAHEQIVFQAQVDRRGEDLPRFIQVAAGIERVVDLGSVLGLILDLLEITVVRDEWLGSFVGTFAHCTLRGASVLLLEWHGRRCSKRSVPK